MSQTTSQWRGKKVFVTGHTGFKGSWLLSWLLLEGAQVRGYSDEMLTTPSIFEALKLREHCEHITGDVRDLNSVAKALREFQPDYVFHLAAQPLVRLSYREPINTFATNVMGTANVLETCRGIESLRSVVVITTDKVYENKELDRGYIEEDRLGGHDPYSTSKACAELVARSYSRSFFDSKKIVTARAGNIIGGGDWSEDRLIPDAVRAFVENRALEIRSPQSVRPWQHVIDPLRGYLTLATSSPNAFAYNFGPPDSQCVTVKEVVDQFVKSWGQGAAWKNISSDAALKETQILKLDSSLAASALGWHARIGLTNALQMTAEWYKAFYGRSSSLLDLTQKQITDWKSLS